MHLCTSAFEYLPNGSQTCHMLWGCPGCLGDRLSGEPGKVSAVFINRLSLKRKKKPKKIMSLVAFLDAIVVIAERRGVPLYFVIVATIVEYIILFRCQSRCCCCCCYVYIESCRLPPSSSSSGVT